jgi:hypothetical protein
MDFFVKGNKNLALNITFFFFFLNFLGANERRFIARKKKLALIRGNSGVQQGIGDGTSTNLPTDQ